MSLTSGARLGPYEILSLVGRGGMGEVYRAHDARLGRDVAIKVLPAAYSADADRLTRFEREARAAAALNHPNILAVYDIGTYDGSPYIVSELLQGQTMRDALGHGALTIRRAVGFAIDVATGLAAAHEKGIVHRDIKPENVFITEDGRIKILDFGLAKLFETPAAGLESTRTGAGPDGTESRVVGTAGYMSPEQVRGQAVDHRSDLFSFGAMLYELVSGTRAFKGESAIETLSAILKHDPPELTATNSEISPHLSFVIQHCLEKERERRFQSARDLAFALSRLSQSSGSGPVNVLAQPPSAWSRWGAVAAAVALLVVGAGAAYVATNGVVDVPMPTFRQLTFRRGYIVNARFAPDGQTVISSASWDGNPFEVLSTRIDTAESTALPLPGAWLLSVSRSGELAVLVRDSILARVPLGSGGARDVLDQVINADWAPDGTLAAIRRDGPRSWCEYPPGKVIYEQTETAIVLVRVSPDGRFVALLEQLAAGAGMAWVTIVDRAGTLQSRSKRRSTTVNDGLAWTPNGREVWFTGSELGVKSEVYAMTLDGRERIVHQTMGSARIHDIAPDGRALLTGDADRAEMTVMDATGSGGRDLTFRNWCRPNVLSRDGRTLVFSSGFNTVVAKTSTYLRKTEGGPAIFLGQGNPIALSPDGNWVVTTSLKDKHLTMLPTGVGEPRILEAGRVTDFTLFANWAPDGQRLVFVGNEAGRPLRVFVQNVAGGAPEPITPEGVSGPLIVSPDSTQVVARADDQLWTYPLKGGPPRQVPGAIRGDRALSWSAEGGSIWVVNRANTPAQIFRLDLTTGRRTFWREVPYLDPAATLSGSLRLVMSADGRTIVYGYQKHQSELYLAEGVR